MAGYIGNKSSVVSSGAERKFKFAITETTTTLSNLAYTRDLVHVFHNGVRLVDGTDYTATNGTSITLTNAAENGDEVVVISYASFQPSDTVSASTGGVFEGNITVNADLTVDTDTLFVDSANNRVGIGTTTAARSARLTVKAGNSTLGSGYSQLSVITSDAQAADVGGSIVLGGQSTAADWVYGSVSGRSENNSYAGYLAFGTSTSLGAHAERMRIDSSGNVGIGISSPTACLHVNAVATAALLSSTAVSGGTAVPLKIYANASAAATARIDFGSAANVSSHSFISAQTLTASASNLVFGSSGAERMRIDGSGNVGIGTSSPVAKLDVVGANDTTFDGVGTIRLSGTNAYNSGDAGSGITFAGIFDSSNGETTFAQISGKKANTTDGNYDGVLTFGVRNTLEGVNIERMRIDSAGNVGIGTSSPNTKLHITGNLTIENGVSNAPFIDFVESGDNTDVKARIQMDQVSGTAGELLFHTEGGGTLAERMRIDSSGTTWLGSTNSARNVNSFRYVSVASPGDVYVHMKTNRPLTEAQMYSVTFRGHSYNQNLPIDASLCWYNYSPVNNITNIGSTGTHSCSAYKSSDGFAVMTVYVPNHYYVAFTMDQFTTAQGLVPITVTSVTYSASATGVY